ncbi:tRNA (N6-isopentenyl adenosine(37)-C2)-methylthiotransferase MiaB [Phocea massiliensis]|uniref:tRNA-2-methylthio-N(6)-dimethylallyladenosine synthase n=1 Tax=uncultured Anaerotruncus sp. TaxID=905011 RepID=A0A6N2SCI1_9FIRM|nr:tRNA (N6-isopentenyl adenosine(37)-C2)-methylthiotransferase MiaB [Merdimmobilis hominis]MCD4836267.1 tRNA (N6-isopentenyl adenosine(37)-C2)-methylthiotransferase MiaB [Merdimmobilis hominis]
MAANTLTQYDFFDADPARQERYMDRVCSFLSQRCDTPPLALVHSFGCQQNSSDTEKLKGMLARMGYGFTDRPEEARLVLFNTCAVRENAEDRVLGNVGALKAYKAANPELIIALCGCMMQQPHMAEKVKKSYPYVDLVFGTHVAHMFPELLYTCLSEGKRVFNLSEESAPMAEGLPVLRDNDLKAWLPIMNGCDNFCSYCIVPYVRGREKSRPSKEIIREATELVAAGYKEITLLGQNVNSYGKGLEEQINFAGLLHQVNAIPGDFRIRFMTSHPKDCTHELIDAIAACKKVCNHIHLPVQCGNNRVLREMNRHYTVEEYLELAAYAHQKMPDVTFTSDIIVGFPGESYEEFQDTLELVRKMRYSALYTFIYSRRSGTRAAQMPDPVSGEEKGRWFQELLDLQEKIGLEEHEAMVGGVYRVLVDGVGKTGEGYLTGRTESNVIVDFKAPKEIIGQFVQVRVTKARNWLVLGELI